MADGSYNYNEFIISCLDAIRRDLIAFVLERSWFRLQLYNLYL